MTGLGCMVLHHGIPPFEAMPSFFDFSGSHEHLDLVPNVRCMLLAITYKGGFDSPSYDTGSALVELPSLPQCRPMIDEHPYVIRYQLIFGSLLFRGGDYVHAKLFKEGFQLSLRSTGELDWETMVPLLVRLHLLLISRVEFCNNCVMV